MEKKKIKPIRTKHKKQICLSTEMLKNKKLLKRIVIIVAILISLSVIAIVISQNLHNIFVFTEKNGFFKNKVNIETAQDLKTHHLTIEELNNDNRVVFDQSLMLINTKYMLPEGFVADISEYKTTTVYMNNCMLSKYAELSDDISRKFNKKLYVSSDFRTAEQQEELYKQDPLTATLPGASEHQTGLALDVYVAYYSGEGFLKSSVGRYVNSHSWEYGFIMRYPSYGEESTGIRFEPWHIRYVGYPHAKVIYNNHITLEEYIAMLEIGEWYEIDGYYVCRQALSNTNTLEVPNEFDECVISPDNTGCYIITIRNN